MLDSAKTLQAYEKNVQEYVKKTPKNVKGNVKIWLDKTLSYLSTEAKILELGSGFGRDADYIETKGFTVMRSDAAASFVRLLKQQGHPAMQLNAITDDYGDLFDMIFADAVLQHFDKAEFSKTLQNVSHALKNQGIFSFRLKAGAGSEWDSELGDARITHYWLPQDVKKQLAEAGFSVLSLHEGNSKFNGFTWLGVIAQKLPDN